MNDQHIALSKFSYQIKFALNTYKPHGLSISKFKNVFIGGLGGSGIGGRLVKSIFADEFPVPVECVADYTLPKYVDENTLVILGSYSGNTEETLAMYEEVKKRNCTVTILTGGGKILKLAEADNIHINLLENGFQPRMALGFSLTFLILTFAELIGKDVRSQLEEIANTVEDPKVYQEEATSIFQSIKSKVANKIIVLTDGYFEPVGLRFSQQINENAKHECFQNTIPEMNHNVIESYYGQLESIFILIDSNKHPRVSARFDFIRNLLEVENNKVINIPVEEADIKSVYEIIFMLDWLSLYIADFRKVDSLNVPNIMSLKEFLESVN